MSCLMNWCRASRGDIKGFGSFDYHEFRSRIGEFDALFLIEFSIRLRVESGRINRMMPVWEAQDPKCGDLTITCASWSR